MRDRAALEIARVLRAPLIIGISRIAFEQRVAEADHRLLRRARPADPAQGLQRGHGGQHGERMIADEPSRGFDIAARGRLCEEHLERQLCERPGWDDDEALTLDEVFRLAEQRPVKRMRAGKIEGQRGDDNIAIPVAERLRLGEIMAFQPAAALPRRLVQPAAQALAPRG